MATKSEEMHANCTCSEPYTYMTSEDHVHHGDVTSVFASFYQRTTMHGMENLGKARGQCYKRGHIFSKVKRIKMSLHACILSDLPPLASFPNILV